LLKKSSSGKGDEKKFGEEKVKSSDKHARGDDLYRDSAKATVFFVKQYGQNRDEHDARGDETHHFNEKRPR
jgi:hypothetical protein